MAQTRKSLYNIRHAPGGNANNYVCTKLSKDFDHQETYHIAYLNDSIPQSVCTCFAGAKSSPCRHKQMLDLYMKTKRVDSGWLYVFDTQTWIEPANPEEEAT